MTDRPINKWQQPKKNNDNLWKILIATINFGSSLIGFRYLAYYRLDKGHIAFDNKDSGDDRDLADFDRVQFGWNIVGYMGSWRFANHLVGTVNILGNLSFDKRAPNCPQAHWTETGDDWPTQHGLHVFEQFAYAYAVFGIYTRTEDRFEKCFPIGSNRHLFSISI